MENFNKYKFEIFSFIVGGAFGLLGIVFGTLVLKRKKFEDLKIQRFQKFALYGLIIAFIPSFMIANSYKSEILGYEESINSIKKQNVEVEKYEIKNYSIPPSQRPDFPSVQTDIPIAEPTEPKY